MKLEFTREMLESMEMRYPDICIIKSCGKFAEYFDKKNIYPLCFNHYHDVFDEIEEEEIKYKRNGIKKISDNGGSLEES